MHSLGSVLSLGLLIAALSATALLTACGGDSGRGAPSNATPPGTYTLTVTATVSGHAQNTQLTLIVQ